MWQACCDGVTVFVQPWQGVSSDVLAVGRGKGVHIAADMYLPCLVNQELIKV
jgi:hypothetical protein